MTPGAFKRKLAAINIRKIASQAVDETKEALNVQNKLQLLDGKMKDGNDIHPNYLEDPFFKTQKEAIGYAKWKWSITPNAKRNFYTPNLFINGFYHSTRTIKIEGEKIIYYSDADFSDSIAEKYGPGINGVGGKYKDDYIKTSLRPEFIKLVLQHLRS